MDRSFTSEWLEVAIRLLRTIQQLPQSRVVLVTTTHVCRQIKVHMRVVNHVRIIQLVATFVKLLVFKLSDFFDPSNIYSARVAGKEQCFNAIRAQHGDGFRYLVVGDG